MPVHRGSRSYDGEAPFAALSHPQLSRTSLVRQAQWVLDTLKKSPGLAQLLGRLRELRLPGCYVAGGAIPQIVWNHLHAFEPHHGLSDFDVVYFDGANLSREAEAAIQSALNESLHAFPVRIEAINEARVHLWYETEFGRAMKPYTCTEDAIYCFPTTASATGVTLDDAGDWHLFAPHGLTDLLGMVMRANKVQITAERYAEKSQRWSRVWPGLTVVPWEG